MVGSKGRDSNDLDNLLKAVPESDRLLHSFRSFSYHSGALDDIHNFPNFLSDRRTELIAHLLNLWPELLPDFHEAIFLLLGKIQFLEIGDLLGQSIANLLLSL